MVRNLLLAGASPGERTLSGQTGLHLAAESENDAIASILLNNNIDWSAVDEDGNNALHVAVREGHIKTARVLLTESRIDAEAWNSKGRSPFHVLARFCDNNAAEMFDLFMECMPEYNIDKTDAEGNTPLLLAYIKVGEYIEIVTLRQFQTIRAPEMCAAPWSRGEQFWEL